MADSVEQRFIATPELLLPEGMEALTVTASDGVRLRAARWPARLQAGEASQGVVLLVQGRAEFIEKYAETIEDLLKRRFAVVTFDWRGQGLSDRALRDGRKGHVADFSDYLRDLDAVVAQAVPSYWPKPLFALAHSMGGAIMLQALARGASPFARVVLSAPMVDVVIPRGARAARWLARTLSLAGLGRSWVPGGGPGSISARPFDGNPLTSDPARYGRTAALLAEAARRDLSPGVGDPTISWVQAAFRCITAMNQPGFAPAIATPLLIVAAGADAIVSTPAIERLASRIKTGRAIVIPGARHEILMERDEVRQAFFAAFDAFIPGSADRR